MLRATSLFAEFRCRLNPECNDLRRKKAQSQPPGDLAAISHIKNVIVDSLPITSEVIRREAINTPECILLCYLVVVTDAATLIVVIIFP